MRRRVCLALSDLPFFSIPNSLESIDYTQARHFDCANKDYQ